MYQKTITHHITKILVDILFYLSFVCICAVPFASDFLFGEGRSTAYIIFFDAVLISSGLCCAYILYNLKQMFRTLLCGNPFTDENVIRFRRLSVTCITIAIIYIIKSIFLFTIGTVIVSLVFIIGCLFCLTLKDLFKQAANYKAENDLTI